MNQKSSSKEKLKNGDTVVDGVLLKNQPVGLIKTLNKKYIKKGKNMPKIEKPTVWYLLRQDVLWYKTGTAFGHDGFGGVWIIEPGEKAMPTLDNLQCAIAEHIKDEGSEEYFIRVDLS